MWRGGCDDDGRAGFIAGVTPRESFGDEGLFSMMDGQETVLPSTGVSSVGSLAVGMGIFSFYGLSGDSPFHCRRYSS